MSATDPARDQALREALAAALLAEDAKRGPNFNLYERDAKTLADAVMPLVREHVSAEVRTALIAERRRKRKRGGLNRWGAFICEGCANSEHHGAIVVPLCQCTCGGRYDSKGRLIDQRVSLR